MKGESRKYSRMLSSFACGKLKAYFISGRHRQGVEVRQVSPAFSSVFGLQSAESAEEIEYDDPYHFVLGDAAVKVIVYGIEGLTPVDYLVVVGVVGVCPARPTSGR